MTGDRQNREKAARSAVQGLLGASKTKALAVAVLLATSAGCTVKPEGPPCAGQPDEAPCLAPSGVESGWLSQPVWPMVATSETTGRQAQHLATDEDFVANPQYTQMRAGERPSGGPTYYGGGHYWTTYRSSGGSSGSSGFSS